MKTITQQLQKSSQLAYLNMFEWVCHKMFCTLLGYTGLNSTYWPKKFDLVCQTVFPFSCERVGSGHKTNLIPYRAKFSWVQIMRIFNCSRN